MGLVLLTVFVKDLYGIIRALNLPWLVLSMFATLMVVFKVGSDSNTISSVSVDSVAPSRATATQTRQTPVVPADRRYR